ncbi:hypothetical protein UJ101_01940 [Flavobacteriaceae bacterium UJ101]|nr:hypothetical protein UJ101_01940 [Flavobacteriaceae bacterium UJ101]
MDFTKKYRENGAIGALLDEYEKAIVELQQILNPITKQELITIVDANTEDEDCRSIQTILTHIVSSGYHYIIKIRENLGEKPEVKEKATFQRNTIEEYAVSLNEMFQFSEKLFKDYPNLELEIIERKDKIHTTYGQVYDYEQLLEHAIVHVLRHRRQIERFLIKLKKESYF